MINVELPPRIPSVSNAKLVCAIPHPVKNARENGSLHFQSGKAKTGNWVLEFERQSARQIEPLMGYTSSRDTQTQVKLNFPSLEAAETYAKKHGIAYMVHKPKEQKRRKMAYSDNFAYNRTLPWTH